MFYVTSTTLWEPFATLEEAFVAYPGEWVETVYSGETYWHNKDLVCNIIEPTQRDFVLVNEAWR